MGFKASTYCMSNGCIHSGQEFAAAPRFHPKGAPGELCI